MHVLAHTADVLASVVLGIQGIGLGRRRAPSSYYARDAQAEGDLHILGHVTGQWIVVYDAPSHEPMNQRIQEYVPNRDLEQLFKKAKEDGLCISSVACCHELWTLVVDAGTGFSAQVSHKT